MRNMKVLQGPHAASVFESLVFNILISFQDVFLTFSSFLSNDER